MPTLVRPSNYDKIELAVASIWSSGIGIEVDVGDYSKLIDAVPRGVVGHAQLHSPLEERHPQHEWLHWLFPLHFFALYESDAEAHALARAYRRDILNLFVQHRHLDDGNLPYPSGYTGQAWDSHLINSTMPQYFQLDGRDYLMITSELEVTERVDIVYP